MIKLKLTQEEKDLIKKWLLKEKDKERNCPFYTIEGAFKIKHCEKICLIAFPQIQPYNDIPDIIDCPCRVYSLKHVMRKAREIIK